MNVQGQSITILGAGLTGSLLAVLLSQRGLQVTVIERQPDPRRVDSYAGRSINLAMAARGLNALHLAGLSDAVRPLLCPMPGRMLHSKDGDLQFQRYSANEDEQNYSVSRAELNRILLDAAEHAGAVFRFEQRCTGYDPNTHRLQMSDERGAPASAYELAVERVIAADGAGSPVRRAIGELPGYDFEESLLDHRYQEISIPPQDGAFALDPQALHIWPRGGFMLIALPNPGKDFTGTLFLAGHAPDAEPSFDWWRSPQRALDWFIGEFPDVPPLVDNLADQLQRHPTGVMGTIRCNRWNLDDRVLLIGDAAHAIVPFHGQGMNAGFEDCAEFVRMLDQSQNWRSLFDSFSAERIPNANAIAQMALENYIEMRETVRDPRFHLKKALAFALERRAPELFISRYSMVMFHAKIPYATALQRGQVQAELLNRWTEGQHDINDVNLTACLNEAEQALSSL